MISLSHSILVLGQMAHTSFLHSTLSLWHGCKVAGSFYPLWSPSRCESGGGKVERFSQMNLSPNHGAPLNSCVALRLSVVSVLLSDSGLPWESSHPCSGYGGCYMVKDILCDRGSLPSTWHVCKCSLCVSYTSGKLQPCALSMLDSSLC